MLSRCHGGGGSACAAVPAAGHCGVGDGVTPPLESGRGTSRRPAPLIGLPQHGAEDPVSIDLHRKRAELDG